MDPKELNERRAQAHKRIDAAVSALTQQSRDHTARTRSMAAIGAQDPAVRSVMQLEVAAGFLENTAGMAAPAAEPANEPAAAPKKTRGAAGPRKTAAARAKRKG